MSITPWAGYERRYVLGWRFGWQALMNEARWLAGQTGRRQKVRRDGGTWLIEDA